MDNKQEQQYIRMTTSPVEPLLLKLSVPTIFSMLITSLYNMADTYFVGNLGTSATGAVGVVFSLMAIIQAVGFFFGHGSGNTISRQLGSHRFDEAGRMAASGFFLCMAAGAVIAALGLIFIDPLAMALGSTETILPYARDYMRYILIATPFMTSSLTLNNQLRFQGYATYAMIGIVSGGLLNIALDPLFIYGFDMGVSGAALATAVSQFVSWCLLLWGTRREGCVPISFKNFRPTGDQVQMIIRGGSPSLIRQGFGSVATICLNHAAHPWGDAAIAAMGVTNKVIMFIRSAMIGFGQGFQPVCGFNYGARLYDRVKRAYMYSIKVTTVVLTVITVASCVWADDIIALFRNDPEVIRYGTLALQLQALTLPLAPLITMSNMMTQTIGKTMQANILAAAWQGVLFIPAVLILPHFCGFLGVQLSQPIANVITAVISVPICVQIFREMDAAKSAVEQ
ncbi:MAG: MATE family efflux transporter [Candidatus Heteroscillospira sp.]|jgi:putative MATE family efflux protein